MKKYGWKKLLILFLLNCQIRFPRNKQTLSVFNKMFVSQ